MKLPTANSVAKVYIKWARGPPLFPDVIKPYSGPECVEPGVCHDPARIILLSTLFGWVTFGVVYSILMRLSFYRSLDWYKRTMWISYVVSTLHAVFSTWGNLRHTALHPRFIESEYSTFVRVPQSEFFVAASVGYFIYDLMLMLVVSGRHLETATIIHHATAICLFTQIWIYEAGFVYAGLVCILEAGTPLVNLRWMLYEAGMSSTRLYKTVGLTMLVAFIGMRVVYFAWMCWKLYGQGAELKEWDSFQLSCWIYGLALATFLAVFWLGKMIQGAYKALAAEPKPKTE